MAHGRVSSGYIRIQKCINSESGTASHLDVDLTGATVHVEKNWGGQFPPKWFWIHCNVFDREADLSLIALGAKRTVVVVEETIGLIAVHHNGKLYEFSNWSAVNLDWNVRWGTWQMSSTSRTGFHVQLKGTADDQGTYVLGPTDEGMKFTMRDSMRGRLHLKLCDRDGTVIVDASTSCAQLEIGGEPWDDDEDGTWIASVKQMKQPLRGIINMFNGSNVETD